MDGLKQQHSPCLSLPLSSLRIIVSLHRIELYELEEGVTDLSFRRGLVTALKSILDVLQQYCKLAGSRTSTLYRISDTDLKAMAILLVRCTALPNIEICSSAALCISTLGQGDNSCRDSSPGQGLYPPSLNALLTNSLLRRLEQPNAYSLESSAVDQKSLHEVGRDSRQLNVLIASVRLMDVFLNAVIDLHTSDDPALLHNFSKLRVSDKLSACGGVFHDKVQQLTALLEAVAVVMDDAEMEKFTETLENVHGFIDYKSQFTS